VLVLPGGRVALLGRFSSMNDRFYERYRRLIVADRAGRIIARRTLRWSEDDRSAVHQVDEHMRLLSIAEIDGVVGVERVDPASRSHRFYPVDGSPSRELAALDPGALTVCRAARSEAPAAIRLADIDSSVLRAYLRGGSAPCIQGIELGGWGFLALGERAYASATPTGELVNVEYRGNIWRSSATDSRCTITPATP
jgi:hypothetical protein